MQSAFSLLSFTLLNDKWNTLFVLCYLAGHFCALVSTSVFSHAILARMVVPLFAIHACSIRVCIFGKYIYM